MILTFCCPHTNPRPWLLELRRALPQADLTLWRPGAPRADYAIVWGPPQVFFDEQPGLKAIFNLGAGVDALMNLRLPKQAVVVRLDDAGMAVQMAEYVSQAVIWYFRELNLYAQDIAEGRWTSRHPLRREDFTVGLMGLGVLGRRVGQTLRQFEFPVRGWSRSSKTMPGVQTYFGQDQFGEFLSGCQILVNLLPLTPETTDILNRQTLGALPRGAYLINVARGAHLVDEDLLSLLNSGHLAGATLDVFRVEPLPPEHAFWRHPAITITPHTSARTLLFESVAQIAVKLASLERGDPVRGLVDLQHGY